MSRVVTPPHTQPTSTAPQKIPQEKIAMRAYEKWVGRGRPQGTEMQDWIEAETELKAEMTRDELDETLTRLSPAGHATPKRSRNLDLLAPALRGGGFAFTRSAAMTLAFSAPPQASSFIRRLDPRWKLAALLFAAAVTASLHTLPTASAALAAALLLTLLARLPPRWFLERLGTLALFLALFTLPLPWLLTDDGPRWTWGRLQISLHGFEMALLLSAKAIAIVTLLLIAQATAPLEVSLKAAHALRIPGLMVQLALLTYRYVFVLADELGRVRIALRVRGYRNRANRHSYRTAGHVAGTLLVRGYERAERVGHAMRCRGFNGQFHSLTEFRTRPTDVLAFVLLTASAAGLAVWDWLPRFSG